MAIYTLPCIRWTANGRLLYSTGTAVQGSEMTYRGGMGVGVRGRLKREEGIYVCIELIPTAVQQKLTQHCNAPILQFKKRKICMGP